MTFLSKAAAKQQISAGLKIGDKVKVMHGSGVNSDKSGVVVDGKKLIKTDGNGIPDLPGHYKAVDWTKEVAVKLDNGEIITMFKNRLIKQ